jgi:hypothetical protein
MALKPMPLGLVVALLLGAAAAVPASAGAATKRCRVGHYLPGLEQQTAPAVSKVRAVKLPRLTDGYAPPCLVAEAVAAEVQRAYEDRGKPPKQVRVYGARWDGGSWRCRYVNAAGGVEHATCRKTGKRRSVTMDLRP